MSLLRTLYIRHLVFLVFVVLVALLATVIYTDNLGVRVHAQEEAVSTSLAVTPAIIDAPTPLGQTTKRSIQITNNSAAAIPVSVSVQGATIEGDPLDGFDEQRYDISEWVRFDDDNYIFEPGQTRSISFSITVPLTANPGGHYAQIVMRSLSLQQDESVNSIVVPEVGVPVLVTVPGQIDEEIIVSDASIAPLFAQKDSMQDASIQLENVGTVHNLATTRLELLRGPELVSEFQVQPVIVLPGTSRDLSTGWRVEDYGRHEVRTVVTYGSRQNVFISKPQVIYVVPPMHQLALVFVGSWLATYFVRHRTNLIAATTVLIRGKL